MLEQHSRRWVAPAERNHLSHLWAVLLLGQAIWGLWFIWRTSFEAAGERVFCLFDDAMISMTYVRNLCEGHGLNWARFGDPVEGYTHPLWLVVMALPHLFSIPYTKTSLLVQLISLGLLLANTWTIRRLLIRHFSFGISHSVAWLPATIATAAYYPLNHWALQGMETALQSLLVALGVLLALDLEPTQPARQWRLGWILGLAFLLRLDLLLWVALMLLAVFVRRGLKAWGVAGWMRLLLPLVALGGGYQIFRWVYFGDWLPNTYYLKMTSVPLDVRVLRGLWASELLVVPILPALLLTGLLLSLALNRRSKLLVPLAVVLAYVSYSIYVGGDVWEPGAGANRFVAFVMPMLFVAANAALSYCLAAAAEGWRSPSMLRAATATAALVGVVGFQGLVGPQAKERWSSLTLTRLPLHVREHRIFTQSVMGIRRSKLLAPRSRVLTVWAGIPAYFSNWEMVDLLGYNERMIAKGPLAEAIDPERFRDFLPGHTKSQLGYALDRYLPDLVFQVWGSTGEARRKILRSRGYVRRGEVWLRRDSANVRLGQWPEDPGYFSLLGASKHSEKAPRAARLP